MTIEIKRIGGEFGDWQALLDLIREAFSYMDGVIDPPSSAHRLTLDNLRRKAETGPIFGAFDGKTLLGCVVLTEEADHVYLGKLAVAEQARGKGVGKALVQAAEAFAAARGKPVLELQTRIELTDNHRTFAGLGFVETARTAHEGYDRPTSITFRKVLA